MHSPQHPALPHDHVAPTGDVAAPSRRARTLRGMAIGALTLVLALAPATAASAASPTPTSTSYGAWAPHVQPVVAEVAAALGVPTVLTRPGHSPNQQLAADFMVYGDSARGHRIAASVIYNAARFRVEYVIWQQKIWVIGGSGWKAMADRGSATANHMDHVHVSFRP
jgi:hypothetical protein